MFWEVFILNIVFSDIVKCVVIFCFFVDQIFNFIVDEVGMGEFEQIFQIDVIDLFVLVGDSGLVYMVIEVLVVFEFGDRYVSIFGSLMYRKIFFGGVIFFGCFGVFLFNLFFIGKGVFLD